MPRLTPQYVGGLKRFEFPGGYRCDLTAEPGEWFDVHRALQAIRFVENELCHVIGALAGQPLVLERWQRAILANVAGWKRRDGLRRYRRLFLAVARKNGKSTLCAALALTALYGVLDQESAAEIYSCASTRDQAKIIFSDQAKAMVLRRPALARRSTLYTNSILCHDTRGGQYSARYMALSADAGVQHGRSPSLTLFDEMHTQRTRDLYEALETGQGARPQPLLAMITTAGVDRETICWEQWNLASQVANPDHPLDVHELLPVIYAADPDDDWRRVGTWRKANPNLGVSVSRESLATAAAAAAANPASLNSFLRLRLNIWTQQVRKAVDPTAWAACRQPPARWPDLSGAAWFAGLDLASSSDLVAYVRLTDHEGRLYLVAHFWVPDTAAERALREHSIDYRRWAAEGAITITEGDVTDYEYVRRYIQSDAEAHNIERIGCDPYNATHLLTLLIADGVPGVGKFAMTTGNLNEPFKDLAQTRIPDRLVAHDGNPVLAWNAANVAAKVDSGERWRPVKESSHAKVDGFVAAVIANGLRINEERTPPSVYETRGVMII